MLRAMDVPTSLKNDRKIRKQISKTGKEQTISVPGDQIKNWIKLTQAAWRRQLDPAFVPISVDCNFIAVAYTYSPTMSRRLDTDNVTQSIQEAMQGVMVPIAKKKGDKVIRVPQTYPYVMNNSKQEYVEVYFWITEAPVNDILAHGAEQAKIWDFIGRQVR